MDQQKYKCDETQGCIVTTSRIGMNSDTCRTLCRKYYQCTNPSTNQCDSIGYHTKPPANSFGFQPLCDKQCTSTTKYFKCDTSGNCVQDTSGGTSYADDPTCNSKCTSTTKYFKCDTSGNCVQDTSGGTSYADDPTCNSECMSPSPSPPSPSPSKKHKSWWLWLVIPVVVLLLIIILVTWLATKKHRKRSLKKK